MTDTTCRIGIDIGGTKIAVGVVTDGGEVVLRGQIPTPRTGGAAVMAAVRDLVLRLIARSGPVTAVGVGAPGVVDPETGRVLSATDLLPGWAGTDVAGSLRDGTGLAVAVDNDVRAAALGEARHGAGAGIRRLLVVSLGTGVGGALVVDGVVQRGGHGTAGEVAHLLVPGHGSIPCGCGRRDHLEAHASGPAIAVSYAAAVARDTAAVAEGAAGRADAAAGGAGAAAEGAADTGVPDRAVLPLPEVVARWRSGDTDAGRAVTTAARTAGRAIAGLAGAIDVDGIVITGGVAGIGEDLIAPLRDAFHESVIAPLRGIPVVQGTLGTDAPLVGAAELARSATDGSHRVSDPAAATGPVPRGRTSITMPARRPGPRHRWTSDAFAAAIAGTLIVSCQAPDGHPLRDTATIARLARAAAAGGATAVRCGGYGGLADIAAVVAAVDLPVIGLTKEGSEGVYITPSVASAVAVANAGAAVVAFDATDRPRPDGATLAGMVAAVHDSGALAMADVSTLAEGVAAARAGADLISTTLSGYTPWTPRRPGPDVALVADLRRALPDTVITAEGRYRTPAEAAAAIRAGADAVIVGTAITDAAWIATQFATAVREAATPTAAAPA